MTYPSSTALVLAAAAAVASPAAVHHEQAWITDTAVVSTVPPSTPDGIRLLRGIARRPDIAFRDGTVEFDLGAPAGGFAGLAFRMASTADYEIVYFTPSSGGAQWGSVQYQPVYEGETTWQLYYRDGYRAVIPAGTSGPLHVRLVVAGTRADVYINGASTPLLRVRELKRPPVSGEVAFWTVSPDEEKAGNELTRLVAGRAAPEPLPPVDAEHPSPGQVTRWRVSPRRASPDGAMPTVVPSELAPTAERWAVVDAEASGLVNLTAARGNPAGRQAVNVFGGAGWGIAFAHVSLASDRDRAVQLLVSYSDAIAVYLDGRRLYSGRNDSDSRYPGYLGLVGAESESVDLPLARGRHDLVLAIADKAFGWGFRARLSSLEGLRIEP